MGGAYRVVRAGWWLCCAPRKCEARAQGCLCWGSCRGSQVKQHPAHPSWVDVAFRETAAHHLFLPRRWREVTPTS
eukprot:6200474-Pleurochrysis_carterae.AAC.1